MTPFRNSIPVAVALLLLVPPLTAGEDTLPRFGEEIFVFADAPFVTPVEEGQPVTIRFGVGEMEIEAGEASEVRADLVVRCDQRLDQALCEKYRSRLRLEPRRRGDGVEVRLVGLPRWKLRKLHLEGSIGVPRSSPLTVRFGIGDVDIRTAGQDLSVKMGIGDLTVHAPEAAVGGVEIATRIGDASLTEAGSTREGGRRMLLGSRLRWDGGKGPARVSVALRIGDAKVLLH